MSGEENRLITYKELSELTGVSETTLRRYVRKKKIPAVKLGHQIVRFHYKTVREFLTNLPTD